MEIGINVHVPGKNIRELVYELGCKHVRMDIVPQYEMEYYLEIVDDFHDHGVSVFGCIDVDLHPDEHDLRQIVHVLDSIGYINEPNNPKYFAHSRSDYFDFTNDFLDFLGGVSVPDDKFVFGQLAHFDGYADWLPKCSGHVLSHHVYGSSAKSIRRKVKTRLPCQDDLHGELKKRGFKPREIWLGETGMATDNNTFYEQEMFYCDIIKKPPAGISRMYFYEMMDAPLPTRQYGIVTRSMVRKPAFYVLQAACKGRL